MNLNQIPTTLVGRRITRFSETPKRGPALWGLYLMTMYDALDVG